MRVCEAPSGPGVGPRKQGEKSHDRMMLSHRCVGRDWRARQQLMLMTELNELLIFAIRSSIELTR